MTGAHAQLRVGSKAGGAAVVVPLRVVVDGGCEVVVLNTFDVAVEGLGAVVAGGGVSVDVEVGGAAPVVELRPTVTVVGLVSRVATWRETSGPPEAS